MFCCSRPNRPEIKMIKTSLACFPTCDRMKRYFCVVGLHLNIRRIRGSCSFDVQYPDHAWSKRRFIHQRLDFDPSVLFTQPIVRLARRCPPHRRRLRRHLGQLCLLFQHFDYAIKFQSLGVNAYDPAHAMLFRRCLIVPDGGPIR